MFPVPIDRLPVELVARIFVLGVALDRPAPFLLSEDGYIPPTSSLPLHVSHVSVRWRHIALSTPVLWTFLRFREPAHLARAQAFLARCASSPQPLDILVDTVAPSEHIPGITLSTQEFHPVFDIITPHVRRWRSLFLKVRDNVCKAAARARLSTCGAAPNLETLQLYHFERFGSAHDLVLATHRPPVPVFENTLPSLRYVSLIGVNLPWRTCSFLRGLHQLELALHRETVRPPYMYWERMLRGSPNLRKLALHYSGPRVPPSWPSAVPAVGGGAEGPSPTEDEWPDEKDTERAIHLPRLAELSLTDLDPEYLCLLLDHLAMPEVTTLSLELLDQDYTLFAYKLAGMSVQDEDATGKEKRDGERERRPYFPKLERLVVSALDCNTDGWRALLGGLTGLRELEVDFARLGDHLVRLLVETWSHGNEESLVLLPALSVLRTSHLPGTQLELLISSRAKNGQTSLRWLVQWCERWRGRDPVMDTLVDQGWECDGGQRVPVETWMEDDYYEDEDEEDSEE